MRIMKISWMKVRSPTVVGVGRWEKPGSELNKTMTMRTTKEPQRTKDMKMSLAMTVLSPYFPHSAFPLIS